MLQRFHLSRGPVWSLFLLVSALLSFSRLLAQDAAVPSPSRARVGAELTCPGCEDWNACTVDTCDTTTGTCRHDPLSCDDGNPCTVDECQSLRRNDGAVGGCFHYPRPDATPCDDGETCTIGESCSAGACIPGGTLGPGASCDDGNSCTVSDACDGAAHCHGTSLGGGAVCDDRNACTRDDRCVTEGDVVVCEGTAQDCSDGDLCTQDRCDPATGACLHPPVDCADGNSCTTDACDPATGQCRRDNVAGACSDGRICTTGQSCVSGNCVGGEPVVCPQPECGSNVCMEEDGGCRLREWGGPGCPSGGTCYTYACVNYRCQIVNESGGSCTLPGYCGLAQCVRGDCQPTVTLPCEDNNPCTDDLCPQGGFSCTHVAKADGTPCLDHCRSCQGGVCSDTTVNCDDANPCTADSCDPAVGCLHVPLTCDDGNSCTADLCTAPEGCQHQPLPGQVCDDGIACTEQDRCVASPGGVMACAGTVPGCDDGNPCTSDTGVVEGGVCSCDHAPVEDPCCTDGTPVSCDDGNACTVDACDGATGECRHDPLVCDDSNACTEDVCDPAAGCVSRSAPRDGQLCDDLNSCTRDDVCASGVCGGTVLADGAACDDANVCTTQDQCYAGRCVGFGVEAGTPCEDGNSCTTGDQCVYPENGDPSCQGAAQPIGAACDDGNRCTTGDRCVEPPAAGTDPAGRTCGGEPVTCAATGSCDVTSCDPFDGVCKHHDDQSLCPPPDQCSGSECRQGVCHYVDWSATPCSLGSGSCASGVCTPDVVHPCDDHNPCTDDVCDSGFACSPTPKADGTACVTGPCSAGTCQAGVCSGVTGVSCDDANPCTVDSCDPATGCVHAPLGCDDANPCTADSCSTASGACVHAPLSNVPCGGDACNRTFCDNGACTEVEPNLCDDHDACTVDHCDPASGCSHEAVSCDDGNRCTADSCDANLGCVHDGPAVPAKEACNGRDDDCDGLVDERETIPLCSVRPVIVRDAGTLQAFSVTCRWTPACSPAGPPETIGNTWLSAADLLYDMSDDVALPDPFAHCSEAIVENVARRMITDTTVTFVFDPAGNGVCGTTGGGRPGLVRALADVPDGKLARVCVKWRQTGIGDTQRCGIVLVRHDAATEPQPVSNAPEEGQELALRTP